MTQNMLNWNEIETVLLDMDGTLLDLHYDNYFWLEYLPERYAAEKSVTFEQAKQILIQLFEETRGTLNWYCLDFWSDRLGINIAELKVEIAHLIAIRPSAEDFLQWLNEQNKAVIMVTNAHRDSLDLKLERTRIDTYFHKIISSHDYRAAKESQVFWNSLAQNISFDNHHTLLVDDSLPVLSAAQEYGVKHLLSIEQPDSKLPKREITEFPAINSYHPLINHTTN